MKHKIKYFLMIILLVVCLACDKDDAPTETEIEAAYTLLAGDWTLGSTGFIKVDDQDISANFSGFTLSFTDGGYSTIGAGDLFNASGSWTWLNETAGEIVADGARNLKILKLNESEFNFSFSFSGTGGEANGIAGNYLVHVVK